MRNDRPLRARQASPRRTAAAVGAVTVMTLAVAACGSSGSSSTAAAGSSASGGGTNCVANMDKTDAGVLPADWCSVVATADKEGKVIVYTTTPTEQLTPVIAAFNKIYPDIQV